MSTISHPAIPDLEPIRRVRARLSARAEETDSQFGRLSETVGRAKARIEDEPEVMAVLEALQAREHQRAVGDYEQLLTLLLQDVLPGERQVVLDLRTERGLPALDVFLRKGADLPLEDALHGTGGSVTNLLSAGLRFIALIRSGLRPFLVLDEADCWIKPALAARFAKVVQEMAEELGVQVIMISHHDDSLFEPVLPHRLRLEVGSNGLTSHWAPTASEPIWSDEQNGIRSIELMDFQAHKHTILPLSPGVTLLQGDNDIGKSAVVKALRSVFYAESNDTFIRHGAKQSKVILDLGPDDVLTWERNRKGKVKVAYSLTDRIKGELKHHTEGARDIPAWVEALGINKADKIDIQLVDQHDPVFLLNKGASERAKALAVGDDASYVQGMLGLSKQELGDSRAAVRQGEKTLETLYRIRAALEPIKTREQDWEAVESLAKQIRLDRERNAGLIEIGGRWERARREIEERHGLDGSQTPGLPQLVFNPAWTGLAERWEQAQTKRCALDDISQGSTPAMPDEPLVAPLEALLERWEKSATLAQAMGELPQSQLPQMLEQALDINKAYELLNRWSAADSVVGALGDIQHMSEVDIPDLVQHKENELFTRWELATAGAEAAKEALATADHLREQVDKKLASQFSECPTCHQPLDASHAH